MGRATQGVRLINLKENDTIASVAIVEVDEDDQEMEITDNNEINGTTDTNNLETGDNDPVN